jgi:hypothetical protein
MTGTADVIVRIAVGDESAWELQAERHLGTLREVADATPTNGPKAIF